jgi:hypothetical protein
VTEQTAGYETADTLWTKVIIRILGQEIARTTASFELPTPHSDGNSTPSVRLRGLALRFHAEFSDTRGVAAGLAARFDIEVTSNSGSFSS